MPRGIDSGPEGPLSVALAVNAALLLLFGLQHSVMARPAFKAWLTRFVPGPMERSTYVLLTSLVLILLFWQWRPIPAPVWEFQGIFQQPVLLGLFFLGVGTVLYSTFLIDHFDLFGLRQVVLHYRGRPYEAKRFVTPSLYKWVRHPLYVGWLVTFWATPSMSVGHLLFAGVMTAYVLLAIPYEERDLAHALGDEYRRYREETPMFVPRPGGAGAPARSLADPSA